jgi:drug/metabolite transporter (DMT)-like permease
VIPEKKRKIAKVLSLAVIIGGIVITGWIFDIGVLKSISPAWVTMKLTTAIAFLLSGITLYFIVKAVEGEFDKAQVALSITSLIIILLMGTLFFSALLKIHTGVDDLFIKEHAGAVKSAVPGRPSVPTMLNFILIASAGIFTILNPGNVQPKLRTIGLTVGIIGTAAVAGYIMNAPLLYYFIEGINSAMACHTAILFALLGMGLLCL